MTEFIHDWLGLQGTIFEHKTGIPNMCSSSDDSDIPGSYHSPLICYGEITFHSSVHTLLVKYTPKHHRHHRQVINKAIISANGERKSDIFVWSKRLGCGIFPRHPRHEVQSVWSVRGNLALLHKSGVPLDIFNLPRHPRHLIQSTKCVAYFCNKVNELIKPAVDFIKNNRFSLFFFEYIKPLWDFFSPSVPYTYQKRANHPALLRVNRTPEP